MTEILLAVAAALIVFALLFLAFSIAPGARGNGAPRPSCGHCSCRNGRPHACQTAKSVEKEARSRETGR